MLGVEHLVDDVALHFFHGGDVKGRRSRFSLFAVAGEDIVGEALETGGVLVGEDVTLSLDVEFIKA